MEGCVWCVGCRFKNKPSMTFDDTGMAAEQEFELHPDPEGVLEYNTK